MPLALKACWTVQAGIVPKEPMAKYTKSWQYTSDLHDRDAQISDPAIQAEFSKMRAQAMDYFLQVSQPNLTNWATITFLWM